MNFHVTVAHPSGFWRDKSHPEILMADGQTSLSHIC